MTQHDDWICVGGNSWRMGAILRALVSACLDRLRTLVPSRLVTQRWIRYRIELVNTPPPPPDVQLERVSDGLMLSLSSTPTASRTS